MSKTSWAFVVVVVLVLNLVSCAAQSADSSAQKFPYDKAKKFLMDKGHVTNPQYFNGYIEDSPGRVEVFCSSQQNNQLWIGHMRFQFILLKTETGQKWLFYTDSYPARAFIE